jgi:hypothetical protein
VLTGFGRERAHRLPSGRAPMRLNEKRLAHYERPPGIHHVSREKEGSRAPASSGAPGASRG